MATVHTAYFGFNGPNNSADFNRDLLLDLLADSGIDGYTVALARGYYKGQEEPSAVVTVICENHEASLARRRLIQVCESYKAAAEQDSVWVTAIQEVLAVI